MFPINLEASKSSTEKFKYPIYSEILDGDWSGVYISKYAPYPDKFEDLLLLDVEDEHVNLTHKLKANGNLEWEFCVSKFKKEIYESREEFDEMMAPSCYLERYSELDKTFDRISIKKAIELCDIQISCDMDYYLKDQKEIESDIGRKLTSLECYYEDDALKILEDELFYKQMCKIFGDSIDDDNIKPENDKSTYEKSYVLRDFKMLVDVDGDCIASAVRGDYYFMFFSTTS